MYICTAIQCSPLRKCNSQSSTGVVHVLPPLFLGKTLLALFLMSTFTTKATNKHMLADRLQQTLTNNWYPQSIKIWFLRIYWFAFYLSLPYFISSTMVHGQYFTEQRDGEKYTEHSATHIGLNRRISRRNLIDDQNQEEKKVKWIGRYQYSSQTVRNTFFVSSNFRNRTWWLRFIEPIACRCSQLIQRKMPRSIEPFFRAVAVKYFVLHRTLCIWSYARRTWK